MDDEVAGRWVEQNSASLKEALDDLEMQLFRAEDMKWLRVTGSDENREFSPEAREQMNKLALYYWIKNPLAGRAVETMTHYTFGRGVTIRGTDDTRCTEVIEEMLADDDNRAELFRHQAQEMTSNELQVFGNIFLVFFPKLSDGHLKVSSIPDQEIRDVILDPQNYHRPLYYKRLGVGREYDFEAHAYNDTGGSWVYYPDWKNPDTSNASEEADNAFVYHMRVNCMSRMKFGISELYRSMDWLKAYNRFLENWASITASLARFAWKKKGKGGPAWVAQEKARLESGLVGGTTENNPPAAAGSTFIESMGSDLQPIKTQGMTTGPADGRHLRLMHCAATGIMDHYFGDPSTGNLATATAMELPMLKMFESRQQLWIDAYSDIVSYALEQAGIPKKDQQFEVSMPPIVQKDAAATITALVDAVTLKAGGNKDGLLPMEVASRIALETLGVDDVDDALATLYPKGEPTKEQEDAFVDRVKEFEASIHRVLEAV